MATLQQMANRFHLELDEEDLTRLRPMVQDLLDVAHMLRHKQSGGIDSIGQRGHSARKSG